MCYLRYDPYKATKAFSSLGERFVKAQPQGQEPTQDQDEAQDQEQAPAQILGQEQKPEIEAFYCSFLKLSLTSEVIATEEEVANNHGRCDLVATTSDHIYIFELKRLDKRSRSKAAIAKLFDTGERQMLVKRYGNNLKKKGKPITMVVLVICDHYRQLCGWRSFKVSDPLGHPVAVDRHEVVLDMELQAAEEKQGLVDPIEIEVQTKTVPEPKVKRSSRAKAGAAKSQKQVSPKPKAKRSRSAKAGAADA